MTQQSHPQSALGHPTECGRKSTCSKNRSMYASAINAAAAHLEEAGLLLLALHLRRTAAGGPPTAAHRTTAARKEEWDTWRIVFSLAKYGGWAGLVARTVLRYAGQKRTETTLQWHDRARTLFANAYPKQGKDAIELIDQFTVGLQHYRVSEHVWAQLPTTYERALTAARDGGNAVGVRRVTTGKRRCR